MSTELIEGYVWLSSYDDRNNRNQEHSTEYKRVFDAIKAGDVHGLQDGKSKRWIVNKAQADAFLAERAEPKRNVNKSQPVKSEQLLEALVTLLGSVTTNQTTLIVAVERLAFAAEAIAKQPLARMDDVAIAEPSGTWRDMNGEAL